MGVSNNKGEMKSIPLALIVVLLICATPYFGTTAAFAKAEAHSSLDDQQRYVSIVRNLERDPLDVSLHDDRAWAMKWLVEAPDLTVTACLDPFGDVAKSHYAYSDEIVGQYMFGMGAFVIENPGKANGLEAQKLAGVESSLVAFRSIKTARPDQLSLALDNLLGMQSRGGASSVCQSCIPAVPSEERLLVLERLNVCCHQTDPGQGWSMSKRRRR